MRGALANFGAAAVILTGALVAAAALVRLHRARYPSERTALPTAEAEAEEMSYYELQNEK